MEDGAVTDAGRSLRATSETKEKYKRNVSAGPNRTAVTTRLQVVCQATAKPGFSFEPGH